MDSIITVKNDMRDMRPDPNERWEKGFTITSENREIAVLEYNKVPEVGLMAVGFRQFVADDRIV